MLQAKAWGSERKNREGLTADVKELREGNPLDVPQDHYCLLIRGFPREFKEAKELDEV